MSFAIARVLGALLLAGPASATMAMAANGPDRGATPDTRRTASPDPSVTAIGPFADGYEAAPAGRAQMPNLLDRYPTRPPWRVAGVDYAVGPSVAPTKDPATIAMQGVTINTAKRFITVTGDNMTLDGYDFSLHGGYFVVVRGNNCTISNSRFVMGSNPSPYLLQGYGSGLTLKYNILDGTATSDNQSGLVAIYGRDPVIQYNWFKNFGQHAVEMVQGFGVTTTLDYRFNLISNGGLAKGAHLNFLQWGRGSAVNPVVAFNTTYQTPQIAGGEGFQFNGFPDSSMTGALFANNTMITSGTSIAMSYLAHLTGGSPVNTGTARDNYFDTSAAYGGFYPIGKQNAWTFFSNYDLKTSALLKVAGATQARPPAQPVIASVAGGGDKPVTVSGSAEAESKVTLLGAGLAPVGTVTADRAGRWSFTARQATAGTYTYLAVSSNGNGTSIPSTPVKLTVKARASLLPSSDIHAPRSDHAGARFRSGQPG